MDVIQFLNHDPKMTETEKAFQALYVLRQMDSYLAANKVYSPLSIDAKEVLENSITCYTNVWGTLIGYVEFIKKTDY